MVKIVDQLDMSAIYNAYSHTGSTPYDPSMLLSQGYMEQLEKQLQFEVSQLLELAEKTDAAEAMEVDIPDELKRRQTRIRRIREAKKVLEERAKERYAHEKAEYEEKMRKREAKAAHSQGKGEKMSQERSKIRQQAAITIANAGFGSFGNHHCYEQAKYLKKPPAR